jgi:transposase-like protein
MEENAECMLVIIGATPEGKKELIGFQVGLRESAQSPLSASFPAEKSLPVSGT